MNIHYTNLSSQDAYYLAKNSILTSKQFSKLQEIACQDAFYAYRFALEVKGADIKYCQEAACKEPKYAYWFARFIKEADIKYCQKAVIKDLVWYKAFIRHIAEADKKPACFI